MPSYWSGTNCKIGFVCATEPDPANPMLIEPTIRGYEIFIGGELTASYHAPPMGPYLFAITRNVVFDSTHFGEGSSIDVKVKVYATDGTFQETTASRPVVNRSRLLVQKDFLLLNLFPYAEQIQMAGVHSSANYHTATRFDSTWTKSDLRSDVKMSTIFSVQTHGSNGSNNFPGAKIVDNNHIPKRADDPLGEAWRFYALEIHAPFYSAESARIEAIGEGPTPSNDALPPYNDGEPVLTIAFVNSCHTGTTNAFKSALTWPLGTRYSPNPPGGDENEAVVSFEPTAYFPESRYGELVFWQKLLQSGWTVDEARDAAVDEYNSKVNQFNQLRDEDDDKSVQLEYTDMTLFGDFSAKAKSVYGGLPTQWWR